MTYPPSFIAAHQTSIGVPSMAFSATAESAQRNPQARRAGLSHAILVSVFGVVIVAGAINLTTEPRELTT
jgi:uncharacterized membrane protein